MKNTFTIVHDQVSNDILKILVYIVVNFPYCFTGKQRLVPTVNLKRASKSQGSSKMNTHCTSQIIVTKNENAECLMQYYKNHYGHGQDIQHLRLSKATRENIASKLIMGVTSEQYVFP